MPPSTDTPTTTAPSGVEPFAVMPPTPDGAVVVGVSVLGGTVVIAHQQRLDRVPDGSSGAGSANVVAPSATASAITTVPPSTDTPTTTAPSGVEPFARVMPPTPPDLVTDVLTLLGLPTTPCSGPQCDETDVGCTGDSPVCFQFRS